jgi:hypothetical protein
MIKTTLSNEAVTLLHRRTSGERVPVTDESRPAYHELASAGIMVAGHSFTGGRESVFKFTEAGWKRATATWPSESASTRP